MGLDKNINSIPTKIFRLFDHFSNPLFPAFAIVQPNGGFWKPLPNATQYVALALAVGKAIRQAQDIATETFIGPACAGFDLTFFGHVFEAGLLTIFDAISVHPYRGGGPESVLGDYAKLQALMKNYSSTPLPIVSGEWGWSTCIPPCTETAHPQEIVLAAMGKGDVDRFITTTTLGGVSNNTQSKYLARQWLVNSLAGVHLSIFYDYVVSSIFLPLSFLYRSFLSATS